jgi:hypothetical protein
MTYREPFTLVQWRAAAGEYESFRNHLHELRKSFSPRTKLEQRVFRQYRDAVRAVGEELERGMKLRAVHLNARVELARNAMADYFRVKQFGQ